jgi:hypothetical protein
VFAGIGDRMPLLEGVHPSTGPDASANANDHANDHVLLRLGSS